MKRLGLIGGVSWVSTAEYYAGINREVNARLGGNSSAVLTLDSVNFGEIAANNLRDDHEANFNIVLAAAKRLCLARADGLVICANSMHMFADRIQADTGVPVIHVASATSDVALGAGYTTVGLLGTRFVMDKDFYRAKLESAGLTVLLPEESDRTEIHRSIFEEMTREIFTDSTRSYFGTLIDDFKTHGANAVILGCTEIPMLLQNCKLSLPTLDTLKIHVHAAVDFAVG